MEFTASELTAGRDYPRGWSEFLDWFPSEDNCLAYLERLRWGQGFTCPKCDEAGEPFRLSRGRLMCRHCRYQCTVTAGTIFDKTRTPLRVWFAAVWYLTNQKQGVSALGLQRVLGLGSYQTAWAMLHRLRRAMVRQDRARLQGTVEIDETYVGVQDPKKGSKTRVWGPRLGTHVVIAVEILKPKGFGRIRLRRIGGRDEVQIFPFVREVVELGSCVRTDGSAAYRSLNDEGYLHKPVVHLGSATPAHHSMPGVHRVAALLKRWLMGTHHGAVKMEQLDYYLDEFTFRFNRRSSRSRGLLFYRLLTQAVATGPVTYDLITHRKRPPPKMMGVVELSG